MKVWTVASAYPSGNTIIPVVAVFATHAEALARFNIVMRTEWEGFPLLGEYRGDPEEASDIIAAYRGDIDADELWGEWEMKEHEL